MRRVVEVDVVVVGCGPVGALAANLLGVRGVRTLVIERSGQPHGQPRAFSCDDEALRIYQQAGLLDEVGRDMHRPARAEYINHAGRVFARVALSEVDFGYGHGPLHFFDQPRLEQALRRGLGRFGHVELRLGAELVGLSQDEQGVSLVVRDVATQQTELIRARYVIGCDGARSTTRAKAGIELAGRSYAQPWLAVSGDVAPEGIRVPATTFVCDWRRPAFVSPGAHGSYRMEFMLRPGETVAEMTEPQTVTRLVQPYVDPGRFTVTRSVVYTFHHLIAREWRRGRVFLMGDAAHQMPPFLGQGLCSGLRDAANLSWKLSMVLAGQAGESLLDTYETERRPHTVAMARMSVRLGNVFLARRRAAAATRDRFLLAAQALPRVRRFVERFEFKPVPAYGRGLMLGGRRRGPVGTMFPQPRVKPVGDEGAVLLDEVLGEGFAVIGTPPAVRDIWPGMPVRRIAVHPAGTEPAPGGGVAAPSHDVIDVGGSLTEWLRRHRAEIVVLRPDRFVYAVATAGRAEGVRRRLSQVIAARPPWSPPASDAAVHE